MWKLACCATFLLYIEHLWPDKTSNLSMSFWDVGKWGGQTVQSKPSIVYCSDTGQPLSFEDHSGSSPKPLSWGLNPTSESTINELSSNYSVSVRAFTVNSLQCVCPDTWHLNKRPIKAFTCSLKTNEVLMVRNRFLCGFGFYWHLA